MINATINGGLLRVMKNVSLAGLIVYTFKYEEQKKPNLRERSSCISDDSFIVALT